MTSLRRSRAAFVLLAGLCCSVPAAVHAQDPEGRVGPVEMVWPEAEHFAVPTIPVAQVARSSESSGRTFVGALIGSMVGQGAGGYLGAYGSLAVTRSLDGLLLGMLAGSMVGGVVGSAEFSALASRRGGSSGFARALRGSWWGPQSV